MPVALTELLLKKQRLWSNKMCSAGWNARWKQVEAFLTLDIYIYHVNKFENKKKNPQYAPLRSKQIKAVVNDTQKREL